VPWSLQGLATLVAARSSQEFACCAFPALALAKYACAFVVSGLGEYQGDFPCCTPRFRLTPISLVVATIVVASPIAAK
jgi:hypothetical protein